MNIYRFFKEWLYIVVSLLMNFLAFFLVDTKYMWPIVKFQLKVTVKILNIQFSN